MAASAGEVRHLFRALLREASRFSNYNVREYVKRRAIDAFHQTSVPCLLSLRPPREEYHGVAEFEINTSAVHVSKVSFSRVFWI